jgi:hypothetical protein
MLLIDAVLQKIVRAAYFRAMMKSDESLRNSWIGLLGACHEEGPTSWRELQPARR